MTTLKQLTEKKQELDAIRPLPQELIKNLDEWFKVELTYTSNAIEGNTLTRAETALVVEKGLTVSGKTLEDHLEAINHAHALDYVKGLVSEKGAITKTDVLNIHAIILKGIDDSGAGKYRTIPVRIAGSEVKLADPLKVAELMDEFFVWLNSNHGLHPVDYAAEAHYRLVTIHPFVDGNGRTARLLMNLILMRAGYPPALIRPEDRQQYISSLEGAQLGGSKEPFYNVVHEAVSRSLDVYLGIDQIMQEDTQEVLLRRSELAQLAGIRPSTVKYYSEIGLLPFLQDDAKASRYYRKQQALHRLAEIEKLRNEGRSIEEMKRLL